MNQNFNGIFDRAAIIGDAEKALTQKPVHITDCIARNSCGNKHEFYSNGDYWWPNPDTESGLPYIRRDGMSNPGNFNEHRHILRRMRTAVASLSAGYLLTGEEKYAMHAVRMLREFFLDEETYMSPHLEYAQAIPGVCKGRGIGIIDTLHLTEIPFAVNALKKSAAMTENILIGLKKWFSDYVIWMNESENGIEERDCTNNHAICWHVQALSFAGFVENQKIVNECVERYKTVLLPRQMREDGGFTSELGRTKPYGYSIFVLDNMTTLVHLGTLYGNENLWKYTSENRRSVKLGLDFLYPYLKDKSSWFLPADVEHFESWPVQASFMIFAALKCGDSRYLELYKSLPRESLDDEVRRSIAIRQPILLLT